MEQIRILGVKIDNVTMNEAVETVLGWMEKEENHMIVTPNPEIVYYAYHNPEYSEVLNSADLTLPDGIGVVYGAKIIGTPLKERVPGFELCCHVLEALATKGKSVFLLGGKPGVAEMAAENIGKKYPGIRVAGFCDGYFKDDEAVVNQINASDADFLMVCTGFPRQENWIAKHRDRLKVKVAIGAGGSVDVLAGTVKRAPDFFCKTNLEWFYRLLKQPSRIGRMMNLPKFLLVVIKKNLKGEGANA
ncbi:MAG: WecB/TagA/CpsF family glycosyltransferase [Ruminococcaceae bacterium]|nr:WecB/TagA/CpsF family glycosyltransferase [Oscillospiraceae bacterium]